MYDICFWSVCKSKWRYGKKIHFSGNKNMEEGLLKNWVYL